MTENDAATSVENTSQKPESKLSYWDLVWEVQYRGTSLPRISRLSNIILIITSLYNL